MKKILLLLVAIVCSMSVMAKNDTTTATFTITPAMHCGNCEAKIKNNLRYEKGVSAIEAKAPGSEVKVTFDPSKTSTEAIIKALGKLGYKATVATGKCCKEGAKTEGKCSGACHHSEKAADKPAGCCK